MPRKTTPIHSPERFTFHSSVAVGWWLTDLPHSAEATRFRIEKLLVGEATIAAVEWIENRVLNELARDLGQFQLVAPISELLFADVSTTFRGMSQLGILRLVGQEVLSKPAFLMATLYDIPFSDAVSVALAEYTGYPLLLVDEEAYARLKRVETDRRSFRLVWLPTYLEPRVD